MEAIDQARADAREVVDTWRRRADTLERAILEQRRRGYHGAADALESLADRLVDAAAAVWSLAGERGAAPRRPERPPF